jgi:hypothetical protein
MDDPVQDRISDGGISDVVIPIFYGKLTCNEGRTDAVTILDDFEEVSAFGVAEGGQSEIIENEQMGFREFLNEVSVGTIGPGKSDLIEELRHTEIKGPKPFPTGLLSEGTGEEGFANPGGAGDKKILVIANPVAGGKVDQHRFFDPTGSLIVNVLDRGLKSEFGLFEKSFETFVFLPGPLTIDEHSKALIERKILEGGLLELFFEAVSHSEKFHDIEFV